MYLIDSPLNLIGDTPVEVIRAFIEELEGLDQSDENVQYHLAEARAALEKAESK